MTLTKEDLQAIADIVGAAEGRLRKDFGADINHILDIVERTEKRLDEIATKVTDGFKGLTREIKGVRKLNDIDHADFEERIEALENPPAKH